MKTQIKYLVQGYQDGILSMDYLHIVLFINKHLLSYKKTTILFLVNDIVMLESKLCSLSTVIIFLFVVLLIFYIQKYILKIVF